MTIDLTPGVCETPQYKAWKFPGGEIHLVLKEIKNQGKKTIELKANFIDSDSIILLMLMVDTIRKDYPHLLIDLFIPYMPYQQADRDFGHGGCFSLRTIANLINLMELNKVRIFDPHSDVTPALINRCEVVDNSKFITNVLLNLWDPVNDNLIIMAPDAGAYKKIFALCEKIGFTGQIMTCSKSRNHITGEKTIEVPRIDNDKHILIIDDICLAGGTFLGVADKIDDKNRLFLAVSHGIFNEGVDKLLTAYDFIYTTNSRCNIKNKQLKVYEL